MPLDLKSLAPLLGSAGGGSGFAKGWARAQQEAQQRQQQQSQQAIQEEQLGFQRSANDRANKDQQLQEQQQQINAVNTIRQLLGDEALDTPELYGERERFALSMAPTLGVDAGFVQSLRPAPDAFTKRRLKTLYANFEKLPQAERQQFEAGGMWKVGEQTYTPAQARHALNMGMTNTQTGQPFAFTKPEDEPRPDSRSLDVQAADALRRGDTEEYARLKRVADEMSASRQNPSTAGGTGAETRTNARIDRIVNSFNAHPLVKEYNEVQAQHGIIQQVVSGSWSGPGDMAAVFAFMKALDPNSVVRETEYANAAKSGNIFTGWAARFNGALNPNGGFLSERVKQDFLRTITGRLSIKTSQYQNLRRQLVARVDRIKAGAPETGDEALIDYASGVEAPAEAQPPPGRATVTPPTAAPPARAGGPPGANPFRRDP